MSRPEILFLIMVSVWGLSNLRAKTGEKIAKLIWAEHDFCETGIREHEVLHSPWNAWKMSICATSTVSGYQVVLQHSSSSIRDINGFVDTSHSGPPPCIPASLRTSLRMCMNYSMLHFFFSACSYGTHCFVAWWECHSACFVKSPLPLHGKRYIGLVSSTLLCTLR